MTLFDAIAEFLGIFQIAIMILLVKEVIAAFTGNAGGMMSIKNPFREEAAREHKEAVETQKEENIAQDEKKKEQIVNAAVNRINALKDYEIKDAHYIKRTIGIIIQELSQLRKVDPATDARIMQDIPQKIGQIMPSANKLKQVTDQLRDIVNFLGKQEVNEANEAQKALRGAVKSVRSRLNASKKIAATVKSQKMADLKGLEGVITKEIEDLQASIRRNMQRTKNILGPQVQTMERIEVDLTRTLQTAVEELRLGNVPEAIKFFKNSLIDLDRVITINGMISVDLSAIRADIARQFQDLNNQINLNERLKRELQI